MCSDALEAPPEQKTSLWQRTLDRIILEHAHAWDTFENHPARTTYQKLADDLLAAVERRVASNRAAAKNANLARQRPGKRARGETLDERTRKFGELWGAALAALTRSDSETFLQLSVRIAVLLDRFADPIGAARAAKPIAAAVVDTSQLSEDRLALLDYHWRHIAHLLWLSDVDAMTELPNLDSLPIPSISRLMVLHISHPSLALPLEHP